MTIDKSTKVSTGYQPRAMQQYIHSRMKRFNVLVVHRRGGKTVLSLNEMIDRGLTNMRHNPQYYYIGVTFGAAKRVAWQYLKDYTKNIPGVEVNESELRVTIHRPDRGDRILFQLLGSENPAAIRGVYADGVVMDECGEMGRDLWGQVVRPALSDRKGWCIFIGTPKGRNLFYDLYTFATTGFWPDGASREEAPDDWFGAKFKASETGIIDKAELEAARMTMTEDEYNQEYECDFSAALVGAYYGKEMNLAESEGRITNVPYDSAVGVETFWDLGISDAMAIWFVQRCGREIHLIDYIEESGKGIDHFVKLIREKPYIYDAHNFPHDIAVRELTTGKTRLEVVESLLGRKYCRVMKKDAVEDGINATKMLLGKCWFDKKKCQRGIEAMKAYERKWDSKNLVFSQNPLHNWASHGADSFRGLALNFSDRPRTERNELPKRTNSAYNVFARRHR
jgi:hypothetical protein